MAPFVRPEGHARRALGVRSVAVACLSLASTTCTRPPLDPHARGYWSYEVTAPPSGSRVVTVEATFDRAMTERVAFAPGSSAYVRDMEVRLPTGDVPARRVGESWIVPECSERCTVRYRIDLGALAASSGDSVDVARRVGSTTLSPSLAWLAHPSPKTDVPVDVHVRSAEPEAFASGMNADPSDRTRFHFRSFDLDEGSFTAFGPMRRFSVKVASDPSARIDVALLGKAPYAMPDATFRSWIAEAADVVTPLFGRFPVDRTTLFVVPARGEDGVVFGKVLSLAGASVVLVVGDKMPASEIRRDWVLVHELFHLGFPTFRGEGRWLGEGLATYYEPILRARAGWATDADIYREFARNLPRGLPRRGSASGVAGGLVRGLASRDDLDSIYWGGALFCFAADVRIREVTGGKHSLDDVVRAALAQGGNATNVWTVADVVRIGDEVTETDVLRTMYARYAARGETIDLEGLFASLGIDRDGDKVQFDESRPLAWVRHRIVAPPRAMRAARASAP